MGQRSAAVRSAALRPRSRASLPPAGASLPPAGASLPPAGASLPQRQQQTRVYSIKCYLPQVRVDRGNSVIEDKLPEALSRSKLARVT